MSTYHRTAAIVSQGDEIVLGQTLDTNSRWLSGRLMDAGVLPVEHVSLPDDRGAIAATLTRLSERVNLIICSGGLGPTADDLTRFALLDVLGGEMVEDEASLAAIRAYFESRGRVMGELNRVQAQRPRAAEMIANPHGTAPGLFARLPSGCEVFCLPGPPREMMPMFESHVRPRLRLEPGRTVVTRSLHTIGLGESEIAARLTRAGDMMARTRNPSIGTTASQSIVSVRMRYEGASAGAAAALDADERAVRDLLGSAVFADGDQTLAAACLARLRERKQTLSVAESCTGGLLGSLITDVAGSSDVFVGGWLTYSNEAKRRDLGVPAALFSESGAAAAPGAVSAEVAAAMAEGARRVSGSSFALSITGIAGPGGAVPGKPVGTVFIGLAGDGFATKIRRFAMSSDRSAVRDWAARAALAMLWFHVVDDTTTRLLREVRLDGSA
ncbi:MAG: CinA family nicotinamide mononucleotide deamidase-related protein [Phycisphaerales bacterium]|nr:CinA family nicotinamide mononucleotide deamidase-related protein [Phycisphaerales bacterium]